MPQISKSLRGVIAVVDDDTRVLESLEGLLESAGYRVRLFSSASALLAEKCLADIDCIISDVSMPQIDGFSLQVRVSAIRPNLPVILISGRIAKPELGYTSGTTSRTVLEKLFDGKNLLAAVSTALNTARARDGRIAPNQYPTNTNT